MNVPKECNFEYPDYTHDEHWGQEVPSYMPGEAVKHYLKGDVAKKEKYFLRSVEYLALCYETLGDLLEKVFRSKHLQYLI